MRGGVSAYASADTVYNEILATRPELLDPLFAGLRYHRRGEELPGLSRPSRPLPSRSCRSRTAALSVAFLRAYMEMAATELGMLLTDVEKASWLRSITSRRSPRGRT